MQVRGICFMRVTDVREKRGENPALLAPSFTPSTHAMQAYLHAHLLPTAALNWCWVSGCLPQYTPYPGEPHTTLWPGGRWPYMTLHHALPPSLPSSASLFMSYVVIQHLHSLSCPPIYLSDSILYTQQTVSRITDSLINVQDALEKDSVCSQ